MATEVALFSIHERPCDTVSLSEEHLEYSRWWCQEDKWASGVLLQVPPPSAGPYCSGGVDRGETKSPHQHLREEGGWTGFEQIMGESVVLMRDMPQWWHT